MALTTLANYTTDVQRLLHDSTFQFWSQAELTDYINAGRNRTVRDTAALRIIQTCTVSSFLEAYPFGGVTGAIINSGGSGYTTAPNVTISGGTGSGATATAVVANGAVTQVNITNPGSAYSTQLTGAVAPTISFGGPGAGANATATVLDAQSIDCVNVTYIFGNQRLTLRRFGWVEFNQKWRSITQYYGRMETFAVQAYTSVYLWRIPDQPYVTEFDTVCLPRPLVDNTTIEQIPYIFQDPVKYYAAFMAKMKSQQNKEADEFLQRYKQSAAAVLASVLTLYRGNQN